MQSLYARSSIMLTLPYGEPGGLADIAQFEEERKARKGKLEPKKKQKVA